MMISEKAGQYLVKIAKEAIEHYIETKEKLKYLTIIQSN